MYLTSRFLNIPAGLELEIFGLRQDQHIATPDLFAIPDLFEANNFTIQLPEAHEEFPDYGSCGCCGCGDDALKDMLTDITSNNVSKPAEASTLFMDTIAGDSSTTATLAVGSNVSGTRDDASDQDWYKIDLVSGTEYTFFLIREGTVSEHADPWLRLFGTDGTTEVAENDDITTGQRNSKITFTATETGTFYLAADGFGTSTGDYRLYADAGASRQDATLDQFADWVTDGFSNDAKWASTSLTYDVSALVAAGQTLAILAFEAWAEVSGLTFTAVTGGATADITFQEVDPDGPDAMGNVDEGAFARTSTSGGSIVSSTIHVDADWTTSGGVNNYDFNSYRYQTYLHEIGHALGLGHGGAYNGSSTYGVDNTFANDAWNYTVMSYHDQGEASSGTARLVLGLQMVDIIAIQNLYGAAPSIRSGDTTYGFNSTETDVFDFETMFFDNSIRPPSLAISDSSGTDTLDFSGYSANQTISLVQETFSSIGDNTNTGDPTDALSNLISIARGTVIENAIGGSGDDTLTGNSADNVLTGNGGDDRAFDGSGDDDVFLGAGDDYVRAGGGQDDYDGGAGTDYISYYDSTSGVNVNLATNVISGSWANNDTITGFESISGSRTGDDEITGTSGANTIKTYGGDDRVFDGLGNDTIELGSGDDYVRAGGGADSYDGGSGTDYISYYDSSGGVNVNLATNVISGSWASNDTINSFEGISGSRTGDDEITGTSGANTIKTYGGDDRVFDGLGNDTIELGSGDDYVRAGGGADSYDGGSGTDYISYYDSSGGVTVNLATNVISGSWASNDTISGFESISGSRTGGDEITGTSGANTIKTYGGDDRVFDGLGNDTVELGSGDDYVRAGGGADSYDGGSGTDYISYYDSSSGVNVNLATNVISGSWASNDTINSFEGISGSKTGDDEITGTSGANTIRTYGGDDRVFDGLGDDVVQLGDGDDYVRAGGGADSYSGGDGTDYISYYDSSGGVNVNLATNVISGSWASNDTISGFESISGSRTGGDEITGTSGANTIKTYGGDDRVFDGLGSDTVELGSGDDYVRVGGGQDSYDGGSGTDYISYYDSTGGVTVNLGTNTVSGSWASNDTINSFEGVSGSRTGGDTLTGSSGDNTLRGYGGDDRLDGAAGDDKLVGGSDNDTFVFAAGYDKDKITDFENNIDEIDLTAFGFSTVAEATAFATESGGDVIFDFGSGDILTVEDATISQLNNDILI